MTSQRTMPDTTMPNTTASAPDCDLRIGHLAQAGGVTVETVRYYERLGLLEAAARTPSSNYRRFPPSAVPRLRFIRRSQDLGFSLDEIRDLLELRSTPGARAREVRERVEKKLHDVRRRISDLEQIAGSLERLSSCCDGKGSIRKCAILDALDFAPSTGSEA